MSSADDTNKNDVLTNENEPIEANANAPKTNEVAENEVAENEANANTTDEPIPIQEDTDIQYPGGELPNPIPLVMPQFIVPTSNPSPSYAQGYSDGYPPCYKSSYESAYASAFNSFKAPRRTRITDSVLEKAKAQKVDKVKKAKEANEPTENAKESTENATNKNATNEPVENQSGGFTHDLEGPIPDNLDLRNPHAEEEGPEPPLEDL
jgi:hypothetical protein